MSEMTSPTRFSRHLFTVVSCLVAAISAAADDRAEILAQHAQVLQAHRENSVAMMVDGAAEDYVLVTRGEVLYPTLAERAERFDEYFAITTFDRYEDTIEPLVQISEDGTLAWLIARVTVSGTQKQGDEELPLEFTSAWIELYKKSDGRWIQVGNVSNFKQ